MVGGAAARAGVGVAAGLGVAVTGGAVGGRRSVGSGEACDCGVPRTVGIGLPVRLTAVGEPVAGRGVGVRTVAVGTLGVAFSTLRGFAVGVGVAAGARGGGGFAGTTGTTRGAAGFSVITGALNGVGVGAAARGV
jgi:hypothetical protein